MLSVSRFAEVWNYRSGFRPHDYVLDGPLELKGFELFDSRLIEACSREQLPLLRRHGLLEWVVLASSKDMFPVELIFLPNLFFDKLSAMFQDPVRFSSSPQIVGSGTPSAIDQVKAFVWIRDAAGIGEPEFHIGQSLE